MQKIVKISRKMRKIGQKKGVGVTRFFDAKNKARIAAEKIGKPCFVDDTALCFNGSHNDGHNES